jgi:dual specificity tyrosine-phosphorylation-regulated kinase 2/3/4
MPDESFIDFVSKCLIWDPEKRMKPEEALKHSWMTKPYSKKH